MYHYQSFYNSKIIMALNKEEEISGLPVLNDNIIWIWVKGNRAVVIDPAISEPVIKFIRKKNLILDSIFQTHHHNDHIGGTKELIKQWPQVNVIASCKEKKRIPFQNFSVIDGEYIEILNKRFKIIEVLGHTNSHIAFYSNEFVNPVLFVGDTLFSGGCGRIFEGTNEQMFASLKKISNLPENTKIYCAHEYTKNNLLWALDLFPEDRLIQEKMKEVNIKLANNKLTIPTTLREEMKINLFLRAKDLNEFSFLRAKKDVWV